MRALRKILSIALLAVFGLPFVSPLLALAGKSDTGLAICCKRNGVHHCTGSMEETARVSPRDSVWRAVPMKCPYPPASFAAGNGRSLALPTAQAVYAGWISHSAVAAQTESLLRISRGRSRQKRGPPGLFSL